MEREDREGEWEDGEWEEGVKLEEEWEGSEEEEIRAQVALGQGAVLSPVLGIG